MNEIYNATPRELNAIENGSNRRDASIILSVINKICKLNDNGKHYDLLPLSDGNYRIKCSFNKSKAHALGGLSSVAHYCSSEKSLCIYLRKVYKNVC